jgi:hypothetical protein
MESDLRRYWCSSSRNTVGQNPTGCKGDEITVPVVVRRCVGNPRPRHDPRVAPTTKLLRS